MEQLGKDRPQVSNPQCADTSDFGQSILEEVATASVTLERDKKAADMLNSRLGELNLAITPGHSEEEAQLLQSALLECVTSSVLAPVT